MNKNSYDSKNGYSYSKGERFIKNEYTYKTGKVDPDLKYSQPEKRRHTFREILKKYRKNINVEKNRE